MARTCGKQCLSLPQAPHPVPAIFEAANAGYGKIVSFAPLLAGIDTPASRRALVTLALATNRSESHQQGGQRHMVCAAMYGRVKNPELLFHRQAIPSLSQSNFIIPGPDLTHARSPDSCQKTYGKYS